MRKKAILFWVIIAGLFQGLAAQDKAQLEKERQAIQQELKDIQQMYNKVKGQTKQTLGQLNVLNRKIALQEQYLNNINKEIRNIDDDIYLSNLEIYRLQKQLDTLKITPTFCGAKFTGSVPLCEGLTALQHGRMLRCLSACAV